MVIKNIWGRAARSTHAKIIVIRKRMRRINDKLIWQGKSLMVIINGYYTQIPIVAAGARMLGFLPLLLHA